MVYLNLKLDDKFFEEEVRDGFTVTKERKGVWAVELDLLNELIKLCNKYDIRYWADGGTMLGCVRHGGFIPWDDDIDVMLLRDDYKRLLEVVKDELKYPYFLQNEESDHGCYLGYSRLCNLDTTELLMNDIKNSYIQDFTHGIGIDVFAFDAMPTDNLVLTNIVNTVKEYKISAKTKYIAKCKNTSKDPSVIEYFEIKYQQGNNNYWLAERIKQAWKITEDTECMTNYGTCPYRESFRKFTDDFKETIYMKFEMIELPVPKNYDHALSYQYGDWKTPIQGTEIHNKLYFDTDKSYKYYIEDTVRLKELEEKNNWH